MTRSQRKEMLPVAATFNDIGLVCLIYLKNYIFIILIFYLLQKLN